MNLEELYQRCMHILDEHAAIKKPLLDLSGGPQLAEQVEEKSEDEVEVLA
jgi:hypothetical protein